MDYNEQLKDDITKRVHDRINERMQRRMARRQRHGSGAGGIVVGGLIVLIGLLIARATLTLLFALVGLNPHVVRWNVIAFGTMLFWSWYFAPSLSAM